MIDDILREWAMAKMDAADNPARLLAARGAEECTRVSNECAARMQRLHEAKDRLMTFQLEAGLPKPLENYFAAVADPGCPRCWISSRVDKQHPECRKKISRYFETERQLLEFVQGNYL